MKRQHIYKKLESLAQNVFHDLTSVLIMELPNNGWLLFNKYTIYRTDDGLYTVNNIDETMISTKFNKLRHATTWVILYNQAKIADSNRVHELDTLLGSMELEREQHKKLKNNADTQTYIIQLNKLEETLTKQKQFIAEIDKYIIKAKLSQLRGFENATKRISRE
jgi:hypothetical protein